MSRIVKLTERAQQQIDTSFRWYAVRSTAAAQRWFGALLACLNTLPEKCESCRVAPESER